MAIKIPLKMKDSASVRTIEELREHWDSTSVLTYFENGKLLEWLESRHYDKEAEQVKEIVNAEFRDDTTAVRSALRKILGMPASTGEVKNSGDTATIVASGIANACTALDEEYVSTRGTGTDQYNEIGAVSYCESLEDIAERNRKLKMLRQYTADDEILSAVDQIAFSQDELAVLLDRNIRKIYLCGEQFALPYNVSRENVRYIGIGMPKVYVDKHLFGNISFSDDVTYIGEDVHEKIKCVNAVVNPDIINPFNLWKTSAENGSAHAQFYIGYSYYKGRGVEKDVTEAFRWLQKSADQGYAEAQFQLGQLIAYEKSIEKDDEKAFEWSMKAAEQGHVGALSFVGDCFLRGRGTEEDHNKAFTWSMKAAEQGDVAAQANIGDCYYYGRGVEQDYGEAIKWYEKAGNQGKAYAQYSMGYMLYHGEGVEADYEEAFRWYTKSAEQGHSGGLYSIGYCYEYGKGVETNYEKAFEYYKQSAQQDYSSAQFRLGCCYYHGIGVEINYEKAYEWFEKSATQGNNKAREYQVCIKPDLFGMSEVIECLTGGFDNVDRSRAYYFPRTNEIQIHVFNKGLVQEELLDRIKAKEAYVLADYCTKEKPNAKGVAVGAAVGMIFGPVGAVAGGYLGNKIAEPDMERIELESGIVYLRFDDINAELEDELRNLGILTIRE